MRASLARSLVMQPKVFLFDEPFAAVDEITRERLNDEVMQLFVREQFAGLFITHSIYEAVFLSTRVLVMSARPGRIVGEFADPLRLPPSARAALRARLRRAERPGQPPAARGPRMSVTDETSSRRAPRASSSGASPTPTGPTPATAPPARLAARRPHRRAARWPCSSCSSASGTCCGPFLLNDNQRFLIPAPHKVVSGGLLQLGQPPPAARRPVAVGARRPHRPGDLDHPRA